MYTKQKNPAFTTPDNNAAALAYDRLLDIIFDDSENVDVEAIKACRQKMLQSRRKTAIRDANDKLKHSGHAVCRNDMLLAMNAAIMEEVKRYEASKTQDNAVRLMAIVVCDAMLKNGPLCEEEED